MRETKNAGRALPAIRRRHALERLRREGFLSCRELQHAFQLSQATARRDINALVQAGVAERVHGGAVLRARREFMAG